MVWSTDDGHETPAPYGNGGSSDDGTWWKTESGWRQTDLGALGFKEGGDFGRDAFGVAGG